MDRDEIKVIGEIDEWVDANSSRIDGTLQALVRCESETHPPGGNEGPVQALIERELRNLGLAVDVFEPTAVPGVTEHPGWWPGLDFTDRPNVVGTVKGDGGGHSLILNGHADVVPAGDPDEWTHPPYAAEIEDGRLYGRGAVDMKGGLASILLAVRCLREIGVHPQGDLIVESVVNEELGGYNGTLACIVKGYEADAAVITEPTELEICVATKGGQVYRARVPGIARHTGWWADGVSALDKAIELKSALRNWEDDRGRETKDNIYYGNPEIFPTPAYVDTIWSLRAGDPEIMANPVDAELFFWVDHLPGEDREALLQRFESYVADFCARDEFLSENPVRLERTEMRPFTGVGIDPNHDVVKSLARVNEEILGRSPMITGLPAASDTMMFNLYSATPALNFGGGSATSGRAHGPDEYIDLQEVADTVRAIAALVVDYCGVVPAVPSVPESILG